MMFSNNDDDNNNIVENEYENNCKHYSTDSVTDEFQHLNLNFHRYRNNSLPNIALPAIPANKNNNNNNNNNNQVNRTHNTVNTNNNNTFEFCYSLRKQSAPLLNTTNSNVNDHSIYIANHGDMDSNNKKKQQRKVKVK
eukprot:Pgem_evm2s4796